MVEHAIPVDLYNPGQVFACLGLLETAGMLVGEAEGGFDWSDTTTASFKIRASGSRNPVEAVLEFLSEASVSSVAPANSKHDTSKWQVPTAALIKDQPFPFPLPASPATLPALLVTDDATLMIDHWGDDADATGRDKVKFWAGSAGYPGPALARDALNLVRDRMGEALNDPFSLSAPQSSSFRFDWRRDYVPMDVGFSPNEHVNLTMVGFPLVEILAAIGLTNARPRRISKLEYHYSVVAAAETDTLICPILLRAALGCAKLPFPQRFFRMKLGWPGQENQARCIIDVVEETNS